VGLVKQSEGSQKRAKASPESSSQDDVFLLPSFLLINRLN